jgi:beta-N-acetylhexosaminidase
MSTHPKLPLGPVMIDLAGTCLSAVERERLGHPLVGGVILFARNYESPQQLAELTAEVHALRLPAAADRHRPRGGQGAALPHGFHSPAGDAPPRRVVGRAAG